MEVRSLLNFDYTKKIWDYIVKNWNQDKFYAYKCFSPLGSSCVLQHLQKILTNTAWNKKKSKSILQDLVKFTYSECWVESAIKYKVDRSVDNKEEPSKFICQVKSWMSDIFNIIFYTFNNKIDIPEVSEANNTPHDIADHEGCKNC